MNDPMVIIVNAVNKPVTTIKLSYLMKIINHLEDMLKVDGFEYDVTSLSLVLDIHNYVKVHKNCDTLEIVDVFSSHDPKLVSFLLDLLENVGTIKSED